MNESINQTILLPRGSEEARMFPNTPQSQEAQRETYSLEEAWEKNSLIA